MSHFSTIKTQLKEAEPLIKALNNLGYTINQDEKFVKGFRGKFTAVDISMNLPGETKVGFNGNSCIEATKNLEDALGKVTVKNKTSDAFISNQIENLTQLNNESNVTF